MCVCICRRRQYSFIMLIYQLVRMKYHLDTNVYVHLCACVCVAEWQHLIRMSYALGLSPSQPHNLSWFPIACADWFSHIKPALIPIIYWSFSHLSGVCEWYWLSNQCADCYGGRTIYSKLNISVFANSFDGAWYWFCIPHELILSFFFHKPSDV